MDRFRALWLRVRALVSRGRVERELDEEFQFHLEQQKAAGVARGISLAETQLRKEECRDMRRLNFIDSLMQDLRYSVRVLRRSPAFTAVAIVSLALGVGANTAIFSVMDVLLLRPLPVKEPNRLQLVGIVGQQVQLAGANTGPRYSFNNPMFEMVRDRNQVFSRIFAWSAKKYQTPVDGDMVLVSAVLASGDYFGALGVPPTVGRVFGREDDRASGGKNGPVAVISDALWSSRYHRSGSVVGQPLVLNGVAVTIIGVMPAGFFGAEVGTAPEVWVPLNLQRQLEDARCIASPSCWYLRVIGRLKPGVSEEAAAANLRTISRGIMEDSHPPDRADRKAAFLAQTLQPERGAAGYTGLRQRLRTPIQVLMALVGFVLLIACANMTNLLTARAAARHREVAVRLAMGAARARIVRQFLTESLLLSVAGAAGGFVVAMFATRGLIALLSSTDNPVLLDLQPDWRVLLFTGLAAIATGFLFGLAPAVRATRSRVGAALKEGTHQIQGSGRRFGFTRALLSLQVALSVVLLAAAGLLAGSLVRLLTESPGFEPRGVTVVSIDGSKLPQKGPAMMELLGRLIERSKAMPGVESASLMSTTPLTNGGWDNYVTIPGRTDLSDEQRDGFINAVGPRMLATMRIPLRAGREFNEGDTAQSARVVVIGESAARRWFPNGALGAELGMGKGAPLRVVGIAGDSKYLNLREDTPMTVFVPYTQWNQGGAIVLRTQAPVRQTYAAFRELLRQVAPGAPIRTIKTMEQQVDESLSTERLTAYLSVFFALLALLLTGVGLYGILAYSVSRRTSEIGVRMALGARRGSVVWLVIREAMGHTVMGVVVGILVVAASSKLIAGLLYGVRPNDPWTMVLAVAALAAVCGGGAWVPARRASRLDPMVALREE